MIKVVLDTIFHSLQKILGYLLTHALIPLLSVIFSLAHETICILYLMAGSTHHTPNPVIYIPLVRPT